METNGQIMKHEEEATAVSAGEALQEKSNRLITELIGVPYESFGKLHAYIVQRQKDHKPIFLVGVDQGGGTTSGALSKIQYAEAKKEGELIWKAEDPQMIQWKWVEDGIEFVEESISTVVGKVVDDYTISPGLLKSGRCVQGFKTCPYDGEINEEMEIGEEKASLSEIWSGYFGAILDQTIKYIQQKYHTDTDLPEDIRDHILLVVGRPSSRQWAKKEPTENFRRIIQKGTGIPEERIFLISEAKATLQYAKDRLSQREKTGEAKEGDADRSWLIIDIGATTMDVQYSSPEGNWEFSLEIGGREVDRLLGNWVLKNDAGQTLDDLGENDKVFSTTLPHYLYSVRVIKEKVCNNGSGSISYLGTRMNDEQLQKLIREEKIPSKPIYEDELRDAAEESDLKPLDEDPNRYVGTWYDFLQCLVYAALKKCLPAGEDRPLPRLVVTGGSCRLVGVRATIAKAILAYEQVSSRDLSAMLNKGPLASKNDYEKHIPLLASKNDYEKCVPFGAIKHEQLVLKNYGNIQKFAKRLPNAVRSVVIEAYSKHYAEELAKEFVPHYADKLQAVLDVAEDSSAVRRMGLDCIKSKKAYWMDRKIIWATENAWLKYLRQNRFNMVEKAQILTDCAWKTDRFMNKKEEKRKYLASVISLTEGLLNKLSAEKLSQEQLEEIISAALVDKEGLNTSKIRLQKVVDSLESKASLVIASLVEYIRGKYKITQSDIQRLREDATKQHRCARGIEKDVREELEKIYLVDKDPYGFAAQIYEQMEQSIKNALLLS